MTLEDGSRRAFLSRMLAGAGAGVALGSLPRFAEAFEHAALQRESTTKTLHFFTRREATELSAVCAQIIPSEEGSPGATEAGVIYFVDYALANLQPELKPLFGTGLRNLTAEAHKIDRGKVFSQLTSEQQIAVLKQIESTDFFKRAREYTMAGFLGDPKYGGNRNQVGWKHIGFDNRGMYAPPFGFYDAEVAAGKKEGSR
jgi:gluconate 2-dehydrogenase gamma chain